MALAFRQFQYAPVPVLSAIGREDSASTASGALVEVGTGIDVELKGGVYVIGASATISSVTGAFATVKFLVGAEIVAEVTFPQGSGGRIGGLRMLDLAGIETRRFAWQASSDGSGAAVDLTDLHFVVMVIGPPAS
jgi:hypothetical protein